MNEELIKALYNELRNSSKATLEIFDLCCSAAGALEAQTRQLAALRTETEHIRQNSVSHEVYAQALAELEQVRRERDAAILEIKTHDPR